MSSGIWKKKIASFVPIKLRKELRSDLKFIENLSNELLFETSIGLFENKWRPKIQEFIDYFLNEWANSQFRYWYRGAIQPGFSHTNIGIEAFNSSIKRKYTDWEKLEFEEFVTVLKDLISDHSEKAIQTPLSSAYSVVEEVWIKAAQMLNDPCKILNERIIYWAKLNGKKKRTNVTNEMIKKYQTVLRARSFNALKSSLSLWKVELGDSILTTKCDCPRYFLIGYCKHILVALIKTRRLSVPRIYSQTQILQKNSRRGRKRKAGAPLSRES